MNYVLNIVAEPESYPITLDQLKCQISSTMPDTGGVDDLRLTASIAAATELCEQTWNMCLCVRQYSLTCNMFPFPEHYYAPVLWWEHPFLRPIPKLYLPKQPLVSVDSLTYYDLTNTQQTLTADTDFRVIAPSYTRGWIEPVTFFPFTYPRGDAVIVTFHAGQSSVSKLACQGILLVAAAWNELREGEIMGQSKLIELGIDRIGYLIGNRVVV